MFGNIPFWLSKQHCSAYALCTLSEFVARDILIHRLSSQAGSVARRGEFSRFVGFLAQKGGQIFEDGELWD